MEPAQWQRAFLQRHQLPSSYLTYAQKWFVPLAQAIAAHQNSANRTLLVAVNGSQGSGKTTVCDYLRDELRTNFGLRTLSLSLDDFYLTRAERQELAVTAHPLLATRGVPGTHNMALLARTLDALLDPEPSVVVIPRFDKALDDRASREAWDVVGQGVDIVLLEGWCLGARAQSETAMAEPVNALEADEDPDASWRRHVNNVLRQDFEPLYQRVDQWVMLAAPSFDCIYQWRLQQEQKLATGRAGDAIMNASQVARFIQFYERLTRHCLESLPLRMHHFYQLDEQRQVSSYRHCSAPEL
jgi:D-glycerate 3-kinase